MDVASTDYLKTALYSGDNGPDTGNRDSLRLMELGLHLETLHDGSHRINTSVDHLLNDPSLSGERIIIIILFWCPLSSRYRHEHIVYILNYITIVIPNYTQSVLSKCNIIHYTMYV